MAYTRQDTINLRLRLIVDPKKFLDLAQALAFDSPLAAKLRTATSRAYYAAYGVSAQTLDSMGFPILKSGNGHSQVQAYFGNSENDELKKVGSELGSLQTNRNHADYRLDDLKAETASNVKAHVMQAKRIIDTLERCCAGSERPKIIKAMKAYDQLIKRAARNE